MVFGKLFGRGSSSSRLQTSASPGHYLSAPINSDEVLLICPAATSSGVCSALETGGNKVRVCEDWESANDYLAAFLPKSILLCTKLPGTDGYSACNCLRKSPAWKHIPLVLFSSEKGSVKTFNQHARLKTAASQYCSGTEPGAILEAVRDAEARSKLQVRGS
jgi:CheY-like chemotaxis protein